MTRILSGPLGGLFVLFLAALTLPPAQGQGPKPQAPQWAYAFDLACRKLGENEFTKDTQKFGVEVLKDTNTGLGVYLAQTGAVGVAQGFDNLKMPTNPSATPTFIAGLDLKARKAGENEFTKDTKTYSMEVFHDGNVGNWVLITDKGNLAVAPGPRTAKAPDTPKTPVWLHSMDLRCRKAGMKEWTKETPTFGLEVYRDGNNGNLIYISETGSVAVVSGVDAPTEAPKEGKAPQWLHGLDLQVRKAGEKEFTKPQKFGVELFRDANNGCLVLISESGNIAVVPSKKEFKSPTTEPRDAQLTHGLDLACRKVGEKDFTDKTKVFGIEVFREQNVDITIYVCETGAISAVAATKQ